MTQGVVIPAFNEASTIAAVIEKVRIYGTVIVVDDGSSDETAELAETQGATVIRHLHNRGYDAALQSGFERAAELGIEFVVTFDADGQHDPAVLDQFFEPMRNDTADLVLGTRPNAARFSELIFNAWGYLRFGTKDLLCGLKGYRMRLYFDHGCFDSTKSIGTELALFGLRYGVPTTIVSLEIQPRNGAPRLGSSFCANMRILGAFIKALRVDIIALIKR